MFCAYSGVTYTQDTINNAAVEPSRSCVTILRFRLNIPAGTSPVAFHNLRNLCESFLISPATAQNTIRVPADASTAQVAIDRAVDGDTVLVSPGIYNENITFRGKAITVTSGRAELHRCFCRLDNLNGTADGPVVTFAANEPAGVVLNGFTVQNGHAYTTRMNGGGIFCESRVAAHNKQCCHQKHRMRCVRRELRKSSDPGQRN